MIEVSLLIKVSLRPTTHLLTKSLSKKRSAPPSKKKTKWIRNRSSVRRACAPSSRSSSCSRTRLKSSISRRRTRRTKTKAKCPLSRSHQPLSRASSSTSCRRRASAKSGAASTDKISLRLVRQCASHAIPLKVSMRLSNSKLRRALRASLKTSKMKSQWRKAGRQVSILSVLSLLASSPRRARPMTSRRRSERHRTRPSSHRARPSASMTR